MMIRRRTSSASAREPALFVTLRTANLASFVAAIDPARDAAEA
jgi:hypothetical protein